MDTWSDKHHELASASRLGRARWVRSPANTLRRVRRLLDAVRKGGRSLPEIWFGLWSVNAPDDRRRKRPPRDDEAVVAIAHELRTPLTTIRSVAEILQDNPDLTAVQRDAFVAMLAEESSRLDRTIDRMLLSSTNGRNWWCVDVAGLRRRSPAA